MEDIELVLRSTRMRANNEGVDRGEARTLGLITAGVEDNQTGQVYSFTRAWASLLFSPFPLPSLSALHSGTHARFGLFVTGKHIFFAKRVQDRGEGKGLRDVRGSGMRTWQVHALVPVEKLLLASVSRKPRFG